MLAVVGLELMPEALEASSAWIPILSPAARSCMLLDRTLGLVQARPDLTEKASGPLAISAGVSLDLFSDGVMIGTGTTLNLALGLLLATGQVPADLPEGFAAVAAPRLAAAVVRCWPLPLPLPGSPYRSSSRPPWVTSRCATRPRWSPSRSWS
ncbi:hypothetical protein [Modestobacter sp. DSM 44400]|uniref:hypothetical protein n=1 Tax=Modestobacter sp. DSM 44400 TaxID=1550230 RepID=UPI001C31CF06|nr:hypothetical protein [Modestobacter sp. DSM 44400]